MLILANYISRIHGCLQRKNFYFYPFYICFVFSQMSQWTSALHCKAWNIHKEPIASILVVMWSVTPTYRLGISPAAVCELNVFSAVLENVEAQKQKVYSLLMLQFPLHWWSCEVETGRGRGWWWCKLKCLYCLSHFSWSSTIFVTLHFSLIYLAAIAFLFDLLHNYNQSKGLLFFFWNLTSICGNIFTIRL